MEVTLNIANPIIRVPVSDTGLVTEVDLSKIPANVLAIALVNGFIGALNNISRSNGKDEAPKTNKEWAKARQDKVEVWLAGEWAAHGGGGERDVWPVRDAFYAEQGAVDAKSRKRLDKAIRQLVTDTFGADESATFAKYLDAVAVTLAKAGKGKQDDLRAKLQAKYDKLAVELVKERNKASAKLDLAGLLD